MLSVMCPPRWLHPQLPARETNRVHLPGLWLRPLGTCRLTCTAVTQGNKQGATDQEVTSTLRDTHAQVSVACRAAASIGRVAAALLPSAHNVWQAADDI